MLYEHKKVLKIFIIFILFSAIFSFLFYKIILVNASLNPIFYQPNYSNISTSTLPSDGGWQVFGKSVSGTIPNFNFRAGVVASSTGNIMPNEAFRVFIHQTTVVPNCGVSTQPHIQWFADFLTGTSTDKLFTFNVSSSTQNIVNVSTGVYGTSTIPINSNGNNKTCIRFIDPFGDINLIKVRGIDPNFDGYADSAFGDGTSTSTDPIYGISDIYFVESGQNFPLTSTSTSASLLFPVANSTTTDFLNWTVNIKNLKSLTTSTFRQVNVDYSDSDPTLTNYFTDHLILDPTFAGEIFLHIPKNNSLLFPNETNRIWYAQARLTETTSTIIITTATSSIISFNVIRTSDITFFNFGETTSTEAIKHSIFIPFSLPSCSILYGSWTDTYLGIPFFSANAPTRAWCEVQQGLKSLINDLVSTMTNFPQKAITAIISLAQNIFPINTIISFNNAIQAAQATTTDVAITIIGQGKIFRNPDGSHRSFVVLASSTTAWIQNSVNFDYKSLFSKIIYLITAGIIIFTTIHIIKSLTHSL